MKPTLVLALAAMMSTSIVHAQERAVEYEATPLSDTVYVLKGRGGNVGVSAGEDGVYLIDDQLAPLSEQLVAAVAEISDAPIRFVINTHYHADHVGGNEVIGEAGAVIVAHDNIRKRMTAEQVSVFMDSTTPPYDPSALPVVTFNDRVTLHLNGEPATAYHVPHGHTDGDSLVHFPESDVIHMGDLFFNGLYPFIDLDGGGNIGGMIAGANLALELAGDGTRIIAGHGPVSTPAELAAYRDMLVTARDRVQALFDDGKSLAEAIEAKPTAEWDEALGGTWITPAQFVTFIYNSLAGVSAYTRIEGVN